jgi:hypothetical protein
MIDGEKLRSHSKFKLRNRGENGTFCLSPACRKKRLKNDDFPLVKKEAYSRWSSQCLR